MSKKISLTSLLLKTALGITIAYVLYYGFFVGLGATLYGTANEYRPVSEQQANLVPLSEATFTSEQMNMIAKSFSLEQTNYVYLKCGSASQETYIREFYDLNPNAVADMLGSFGVYVD